MKKIYNLELLIYLLLALLHKFQRLSKDLFFEGRGPFLIVNIFHGSLELSGSTMQKLKNSFLVLQCIGLWRPVHWRPGWKSNIYNIYTWLIMFILISATFTELIAFVISIDDFETFANNSFVLFSMILDCGKSANILMKRSEIIELINVLERNPCRPKDEKELVIQKKFDRIARSITLRFGAIVGSAAVGLTLRSLLQDLPHRALPYDAWIPFNHYESLVGFSFVYTTQIIALILGCAVGVGFDTLLPGLMLQTCAQLNILKHRFQEMPRLLHDKACVIGERDQSYSSISNSEESKFLSQHVKHHLEIYKFAKTSNNLFSIMIFLQCVVSTLVLCMTLLELTKMKLLSTPFAAVILYMADMSAQIFMYCFYGCQVTFESLTVGDAIYGIDWASLSISAQRSLLTIMTRTLRPIEFISGSIVTLNLDSFNSLIKLSYSVYNVLQQTQK